MSDLTLFNQLFAKYKDRFIYFAYAYLRDEEAAKDIVMDSFIYYWENRESIKKGDNIPSYILKVVKNKCLNYLRAQNVREKAEKIIDEHNMRVLQVQISTLEACDPQNIFSEEAQRLVRKALDSMKPQTREIFIRSRDVEQTYKEIANEMDVSVKVVEFHVSKALQILRLYLKDYNLPLLLFSSLLFSSLLFSLSLIN